MDAYLVNLGVTHGSLVGDVFSGGFDVHVGLDTARSDCIDGNAFAAEVWIGDF